MKRCRKLTKEEQQELRDFINNNNNSSREARRAQSIILLNRERSVDEIIEITGIKHSQIFELRKKYIEKGLEAIKDKRKGKPKELLTRKQRDEISNILKTKKPRDCGYENEYWTTGALGDLIEKQHKVKYKSKTSLYLIFKEAKFTYHKPGRIYHQRDEEEVKKWKKSIKPKLKQAWSDENTVILIEDEMIISTQTTTQKIWLPQGEDIKIEVSNKRENRSIYGFLNLKTGKEYSFKTLKQNMFITKGILEKITNIFKNKKILLFWDGAGWHRGSDAQEFIKENKNIETIYFPKYSPEENPQEHIWKNGRSKTTHNKFIEDIDKATDEFVNYLNKTIFPYELLGFKSDFWM